MTLSAKQREDFSIELRQLENERTIIHGVQECQTELVLAADHAFTALEAQRNALKAQVDEMFASEAYREAISAWRYELSSYSCDEDEYGSFAEVYEKTSEGDCGNDHPVISEAWTLHRELENLDYQCRCLRQKIISNMHTRPNYQSYGETLHELNVKIQALCNQLYPTNKARELKRAKAIETWRALVEKAKQDST